MYMMRITHYGYLEEEHHSVRLNRHALKFAPNYIGLNRHVTGKLRDTQMMVCGYRDAGLAMLIEEARAVIKNRFDDPPLDSFFVRISIAENDKGRFWPDEGEERQYRLSDGEII